jgi:hypothetical protein
MTLNLKGTLAVALKTVTVKVVSWLGLLFLIKMMEGSAQVASMSRDRRNEEQIGGTEVRVGDCQIWAAIHYLDSHTNYREFLPCDARRAAPPDDSLVMLDDIRRPRWFLGIGMILGALLTLILLRSCGC